MPMLRQLRRPLVCFSFFSDSSIERPPHTAVPAPSARLTPPFCARPSSEPAPRVTAATSRPLYHANDMRGRRGVLSVAVAVFAALFATASAVADPEKTVFTSFTIPNDTSGEPVRRIGMGVWGNKAAAGRRAPHDHARSPHCECALPPDRAVPVSIAPPRRRRTRCIVRACNPAGFVGRCLSLHPHAAKLWRRPCFGRQRRGTGARAPASCVPVM
jgi:hypothetical protein